MIVTFRITMKLLTLADSLMPITRIVDISTTMNTAGKLSHAPVKFRPARPQPATACSTCRAVHHCVGEAARWGGITMPNWLSSDTRWPDQPTPTVAAPAAYSSTRSQPMIQAMNSPIVA